MKDLISLPIFISFLVGIIIGGLFIQNVMRLQGRAANIHEVTNVMMRFSENLKNDEQIFCNGGKNSVTCQVFQITSDGQVEIDPNKQQMEF